LSNDTTRRDAATSGAQNKKQVSAQLSSVTYLHAVRKTTNEIGNEHKDKLPGGVCAQMISLSESKVLEMCRERREYLIAFNKQQLSRVYPKGTRIQSSNMDDETVCAAWEAGCHMIALNYQTWDGAMQLNRARFALNNNYGYVLQSKPPILAPKSEPKRLGEVTRRTSTCSAADELPDVWPPAGLAEPEKLRVVVLSASHLPKRELERCQREQPWDDVEVPELGLRFDSEIMSGSDVVTPVVEIDVVGGLVSSCSQKVTKARLAQWNMAQTRYSVASPADPAVEANGLNPHWDEPLDMTCVVWHPAHAFIRFSVYRRSKPTGYSQRPENQLLAYEMIPIACLRQGYRSVPLRSKTGQPISDCALFVFISRRDLPFEKTSLPQASFRAGSPGLPIAQESSTNSSSNSNTNAQFIRRIAKVHKGSFKRTSVSARSFRAQANAEDLQESSVGGDRDENASDDDGERSMSERASTPVRAPSLDGE